MQGTSPAHSSPASVGSAAASTAAASEPAAPAAPSEEATISKSLASPSQPTEKMLEDHNVSHIPFRSWCVSCVRGRGKSCKHMAQGNHLDEAVPTISMDYGFFGRSGETRSDSLADSECPVVILHDRQRKTVWSHPLPSKGIEHPYCAKVILQDLAKTGYKRLILKTDQEASILALAKSVKDSFPGEIILESSPKGQSKSNGEAERAVQTAQGLARTLKDFVEQAANFSFDPSSPVIAWMIEYGGVLHNLFHLGEPNDGMTAYHRWKGRPWKIPLPPFGECVEFSSVPAASWTSAGTEEFILESRRRLRRRSLARVVASTLCSQSVDCHLICAMMQ